jgi:glutamyl-tRNA synthetase
MLGFLLVDPSEFAVDPADATAVLDDSGRAVIRESIAALEPLGQWTAASIEEALRSVLIDGMGLKPKVAFGPVRVAVTGRRVSPPLFESMEILGRETCLARLSAMG